MFFKFLKSVFSWFYWYTYVPNEIECEHITKEEKLDKIKNILIRLTEILYEEHMEDDGVENVIDRFDPKYIMLSEKNYLIEKKTMQLQDDSYERMVYHALLLYSFMMSNVITGERKHFKYILEIAKKNGLYENEKGEISILNENWAEEYEKHLIIMNSNAW